MKLSAIFMLSLAFFTVLALTYSRASNVENPEVAQVDLEVRHAISRNHCRTCQYGPLTREHNRHCCRVFRRCCRKYLKEQVVFDLKTQLVVIHNEFTAPLAPRVTPRYTVHTIVPTSTTTKPRVKPTRYGKREVPELEDAFQQV